MSQHTDSVCSCMSCGLLLSRLFCLMLGRLCSRCVAAGNTVVLSRLFCLMLGLLCSRCVAAGNTVVIRQLPPGVPDTQLLQAFSNQTVTKILLASDYKVGSQFDIYSGPIETTPTVDVSRNITLTGLPGLDPPPMLNFQFKLCVLLLCNDCWFHIVNITVKDDRMGANAQFDFFVGEGSSVIYARDVVRNRQSCTNIDTAGKLVERTQRSSRFLGPHGSTKQMWEARDLVWRGQLFPQTLHLQNYSVEFPKHYNGGYIVVLNNTWRMCHRSVDPTCLAEKDADMCVFQDLQRILALQQQHHEMSAGALAGIIAAVVGSVLLAGALGGFLCFKKRRQQAHLHRNSKASLILPDVERGSSLPSAKSCDVASIKDSNYGRENGHTRADGERAPVPKPGDGDTGSGALFAEAYGSSPGGSGVPQQVGYRSHPAGLLASGGTLSGPLCNVLSDLQFGAVLGTGSFGRVYKARLGDCDLAVKVIDHENRMSSCVANEVNLMLSCKHANVVCAYHYITFRSTRSSSDAVSIRGLGSKPTLPRGSGVREPVQWPTTGPGSGGSNGQRGSNSSMDVPIPVLFGPKSTHVCPACERESRPPSGQQHSAGSYLTISNSTAPPPFSSGSTVSSSSSSGCRASSHGGRSDVAQGSTGPELKCICSCSSHTQVQSGLLKWQHEGGFWPAGPSALLEQHEAPDFEDHDDDSAMVTTWLIQELCDSGTLAKQANSWLPNTEDDRQMIKRLLLLQDVVKGLSYLHSKNIVHGDLNARNVLVTTNYTSPCDYMAKLADLGLSRIIKQHNTHHTTCTVGTMSHMPPELLRHGHMSTAVDIYAFGIMMWEVYTREIAFRELHYGQFFETVVLRDQRPPVPQNIPEDYRVLMEHCWAADPGERPTTAALLKCIGLMIADRQHGLGMPVRSSIDSVDREYSKHGLSGSSVTRSLQQLAVQCQQQQQQQQQQHWQGQPVAQRYPTPARLPPSEHAQQHAPLQQQHYGLHQQQQQQQSRSPRQSVPSQGALQPKQLRHHAGPQQLSPPGDHLGCMQPGLNCSPAVMPGSEMQAHCAPATMATGPATVHPPEAAAADGQAAAGAAVGEACHVGSPSSQSKAFIQDL